MAADGRGLGRDRPPQELPLELRDLEDQLARLSGSAIGGWGVTKVPRPGTDQTGALEPAVDGARGVHVDARSLGERAHARQPVAGSRAPLSISEQFPDELRAHGSSPSRFTAKSMSWGSVSLICNTLYQ